MGHPDFHDTTADNSIQTGHFIVYNTQQVHFAHEALTYRKKNGVFSLGGSCFRAHAPAATSHDRQPKHPPAAQESPCAGVVIVYEPAGGVQQPYSETCSPFQAQ